jgi:hypothetical protein
MPEASTTTKKHIKNTEKNKLSSASLHENSKIVKIGYYCIVIFAGFAEALDQIRRKEQMKTNKKRSFAGDISTWRRFNSHPPAF